MAERQLFMRDGALVEFQPGPNGYTIERRGKKRGPPTLGDNGYRPQTAKVISPETEETKKKFALMNVNGKELYGY